MSDKIIVPTLGESVTEATVSKWLKSVGEEVNSDEPVVELETDKVNVEVPSPSSGILEKISVNEGDTVGVGTLLGRIKQGDTNLAVEKKYSPPPKKQVQVEPAIYEEEKPKKQEKKKNGTEKLVLNEAVNEELPLVLDEEDIKIPKKISKP